MQKRWYWTGRYGFIKGKLAEFKKYAETLEDCLNRELSKLKLTIAEEEAKLESEDEKDLLRDAHCVSRWELSELFPCVFRACLFVTCYSFLENELNEICELLQKKNNYSTHYSDIKTTKQGIKRAQYYLKKNIMIDFPDKNKVWTEILRYKDIRNIIVHNDGRLINKNERFKKEFKRAEDYIKKNPSIHLDSFNRIQLSFDFILEVITTIESFFEQIFELIGTYEKYQEV